MIDFGYGVKLDRLSEDEARNARLWRNDPDIWKWCRQFDLISPMEQEQWYEDICFSKKVSMYSIRKGGTAVGVCGLTDINHLHQRAEFSLYITTTQQRKGYAKAALKTLIHHGFTNLNLHNIWGETFDGNPAESMFIQLGLKHEGTRRQFYFKNGKWLDAHLYSILREEWTGWKSKLRPCA